MVFYFTSNVVQPPVTLFMGLDKYESKVKSLNFYCFLFEILIFNNYFFR